MRRGVKASGLGVTLAMLMACLPFTAHVRAADSIGVDSWIEISSTRPAVGCSISLSIELRSDGHAVDSTEVSAALFADDEVISSDSGVSNGEGVAHISVDTGSASGNGWLDINVAGGYLTGLYIGLGAGSSCDDGADYMTAEGTVPDVRAAASSDSSDGSSGVFVSGVPFYAQQRNLSCEYASLYIATASYGDGVSEYAFDDVVGWSPNPHWGYRGDINGAWGNTTDYGVYAEALAAALPDFGYTGDVNYGMGDPSWIKARIDDDVPVLVWLALWGDQSSVETYDGVSYTVTAGMHVVVAYGYDDSGIWVSDPAIGGARHYTWSDFNYLWSVLDGMSLAVYQG